MDPARLGPIAGLADRAQPIERPGQGELGGAEAVDEVAAPDPARLLERPQDRVDPEKPPADSLADDGLPGENPVAIEKGQGERVEPLGRGGLVEVGCRLDQGPAPGGLRRAEAGQPARSAPWLAAGPVPAQGPERGERVVGHLARPDQVPQRVEDVAVRAAAGRGVDGPVERRTPAHQELTNRLVLRPSRPAFAARSTATDRIDQGVAEGLAAGPDEGDPAVVTTEAAPPHPGHLAQGTKLVEQARLVARHPRREDVPLEHRRRDRQAGELVDHLGQPLEGGRSAQRRGPKARRVTQAGYRRNSCQSGRNRPSAAGSTGSTSRRSRASDRRRSWRRTSGSHHSRSAPPGRNSPRRRAPEAISRSRASSTRPTGRPQRAAGSTVRNGPWVRAQRPRRPSRAALVGARNACGTPAGGWTPIASR